MRPTSLKNDAPSRGMSVGTKFALVTGFCTLVVMAVTFAFVSVRVQNESALQSERIARAAAERIADSVRGAFEGVFNIVDTTHDSLVALKNAGIVDPEVYDTILRRMIDAGSNRYGAWLQWDEADQPLLATARSQSRLDAQGRFATYWHQNGMEMLRDAIPPEILASDLYRVPYEQSKAYLLEPHAIEATDGDPTLVMSFSRPLERDGKVVGVLALDLKLDGVADALSTLSLPADASITVVSSAGIVAMSTGQTSGGGLASIDPATSRLLDAARQGDGSALAVATDGSTKVLTSWSAIRFAGVQNPWYLLMAIPERSLLTATSNDHLFLLLVAAALVAIFLAVHLTMRKLVVMPLKSLSGAIDGLKEGKFETIVQGRGRQDEVGEIAQAVESLRKSGLEIARLREAGLENDAQRQVARRAELDGISTHFSHSIETMVATLGSVASTVDTQSRQVSASMTDAMRRLASVSDASAAARSTMASVATATGSLLATIESIGSRTREGRVAAERVENHTASTDRSIAKLKERVGEIDTVASLIRAVAGQINLIALNATIEAARAGEAGRGFAVVAHEIKELAAQTANATTRIGQHIEAVRKASGEADGSIVEMKDAFRAMHLISADIAGALEIQQGATGEIGALVTAALEGADGVAEQVSALVSSSHHVQGAADVMLGQSASLGEEISGLNGEVSGFLQFLKVA